MTNVFNIVRNIVLYKHKEIMKTLTLKPQHETSVIGQMIQLVSSINYHKNEIAPRLQDAELFERKEYEAMNNENIQSLSEMKAYIIENENVFNDLLSSYGLSVSVFINKFILN